MKPGTTEYKALHSRIARRFGTPQGCEECKTSQAPRYEWANLSGEYKEERDDWLRLCLPCHRNLDKDSYVGKRFTGRSHSEKSRSKAAESMRKYWAENREKMLSIQLRGKEHGRYVHGKYMKED